MKKKIISILYVAMATMTNAQVPTNWTTGGIGGGGALFAPTINPANNNEFCISSDLSAIYRTYDAGLSYSIFNAQQIQGFHNSTIRYTSTAGLMYSINYSNNLIVPIKTTDFGATWITLAGTPNIYNEAYSIWVDYNNSNNIILGYYSEIYFSANGGSSFSKIHSAVSNGAGCLIGGVFFDESNIYIGTNDGIIYSTNGGSSFSVLSTTGIGASEALFSFGAAKEGNTTRFFCLTGKKSQTYNGQQGNEYYGYMQGVYTMDNASGTWIKKMNGINISTDFLMFVGMAENNISTCYIAGSSSANYPNVMKTTDAGATWTHVFNTTNNENIFTGWCGSGGDKLWYWAECPFGFAVASNNANVALFGDYSMVTRTGDGGTTWKQAYVSPEDVNAAGANTPTKKYYHSIGMENTACWQIFWIDSMDMYGAYTDIFAIRSKDAGKSWSFDYNYTPSNTVYRIAKNIADNTLYAATSSIHDLYKSYKVSDASIDYGTGKIIFSTDNGSSWSEMHDFTDPVYWVAADPTNSNRLYVSVVNYSQNNGGIWVSSNINLGAGSTWTKLAAPPRTQGHPASITVLNNGNVLCSFSGRYSGSTFTNSSGVFLYNINTATWSDVSDADQFYYTKDVVSDPNDVSQQTWYAAVWNGWGGNGNGKQGLYKTVNGGASWSKIYTGSDVSSCTFSPLNPDLLFVTTHGNGLWACSNINDAVPVFYRVESFLFANPERVFFNPYNLHEIRIATFGYGMVTGNIFNTAVNEPVAQTNFQVFPNPTTGQAAINFNKQDFVKATVALFDVTGREVYNAGEITMQNNLNLDLSQIPKGFYLLKIQLDDRYEQKKIVVQ